MWYFKWDCINKAPQWQHKDSYTWSDLYPYSNIPAIWLPKRHRVAYLLSLSFLHSFAHICWQEVDNVVGVMMTCFSCYQYHLPITIIHWYVGMQFLNHIYVGFQWLSEKFKRGRKQALHSSLHVKTSLLDSAPCSNNEQRKRTEI